MPKTNKMCCVIYEESNPIGKVVDFFTSNHFSAVISPEHDEDTWTPEDVKVWRASKKKQYGIVIPEDAETWERPVKGEWVTGQYGQPVPKTETSSVPRVGDLKKKHRHVYLEFDYSMPLNTMLEKVAPLNIYYLEEVQSKRAYLRYLCHLDTPEKARYKVEDVIALGGVDISVIWSQDQGAKYEQDMAISKVIRENRIRDIRSLCEYLAQHDYRQMYAEVKGHYGYWAQYMRSGYHVYDEQTVKLVPCDEREGEGTAA